MIYDLNAHPGTKTSTEPKQSIKTDTKIIKNLDRSAEQNKRINE